jgi:hypothetical protein
MQELKDIKHILPSEVEQVQVEEPGADTRVREEFNIQLDESLEEVRSEEEHGPAPQPEKMEETNQTEAHSLNKEVVEPKPK